MAQMVKRLPTMWDTWVESLGQEDLLEKEMATHSSILAWKIPWMEEPGRLQSMGSQSWTRLSDFTFLSVHGKNIQRIPQISKRNRKMGNRPEQELHKR